MLLSSTVTSETKAALLVQSAGLVGMGVSGVGVALACSSGVSVATIAMVASVAGAAWVSVSVKRDGVHRSLRAAG